MMMNKKKFFHTKLSIVTVMLYTGLYNTLALRNTELLHLYSSLDKRVLALGFITKVFAKACDIGDASKGSLSSYAYILMLIHYLQHTNPPVLPVLQELVAPGSDIDPLHPPAKYMVDNWNTYFLDVDNLKSVATVWKDHGKNRASLTELWIGFLRYYVEDFDFDMHVVCIRRFEPLTKFEKLWTGAKMMYLTLRKMVSIKKVVFVQINQWRSKILST